MLVFEEEYRLLSQEGHLTKSSLLAGLDSIRRANIDDQGRGFFYSGLFELSIGFERLMKIVVVLQHKLENDNLNPTNKQLRAYGHNILDLYKASCSIANKHNVEMKSSDDQQQILEVLSLFGTGSRYYNLDQITESPRHEDPLKMWSEVINSHIWGLKYSTRQKLEANAFRYTDKMNMASSWYPGRNIDGELMMMSEFHYLYHATEKANFHIVWTLVSLLSPFYSLLSKLSHELHNLAELQGVKQTVPYMYEFFSFFLAPKNLVLKRKKWG
ncbi:hypothetical protein C9J22_04995 [Photobacterium phosphoreum]|uniref:hypothetical protein n=1 Tax=Photobacterium phosphoreum TaxID=659 RepID=UPI000D17DAA4|nr:hypothetical protein [Photobacterium phosphoreum]PSU73293.1 hypothetical protein C9J22_04995 [Photobacterium phosphoreum]